MCRAHLASRGNVDPHCILIAREPSQISTFWGALPLML
jgi:hypothetical protein